MERSPVTKLNWSSLFPTWGRQSCITLLIILIISRSLTLSAANLEGRSAGLPQIILDAHCDVLQRVLDRNYDLAGPTPKHCQSDIPLWREGGMNAIFLSVWVDPRDFHNDAAVCRAWDLIAAYKDQLRRHSDTLVHCETAAEVRQAINQGKIATLLGIEGGIAINNDLSLIREYRAAGVTHMTLTWRGNLAWAGSANPRNGETTNTGLNKFGREVVRQLNQAGMVVDLSHVSDQTFYDALAVTSKPVFVTHSNARALSHHSRNLTDEMLRALATNGGVIGANFYWDFLEREGRGSDERGATTVTLETVLDHIDHMVQVAGIDHVGIGSDWEGDIEPALGLENASKMPDLIAGLRRRGYSEDAVRKISAENFLRVLMANEQGSAVLQAQ
jgi:membrane dipeptidase